MTVVEMARRVRLRERSAKLRSTPDGGWRIMTDDGRELGAGRFSASAWSKAYRAIWPEHFENEEASA